MTPPPPLVSPSPPSITWGESALRDGVVTCHHARRAARARARTSGGVVHHAQLRLRSHARAIERALPPPPPPRAWWESVLRDGVMA